MLCIAMDARSTEPSRGATTPITTAQLDSLVEEAARQGGDRRHLLGAKKRIEEVAARERALGLSVEVAPAEEPRQRERGPQDYALLASDEEESHRQRQQERELHWCQ